MGKLVLIGGGGHARDIFGLIEDINEVNPASISITTILDDTWENKKRFQGCNVELVVGIERNLNPGDKFIICIGYPKNRKLLGEMALKNGLAPFEALVHPSANIAKNCQIGAGSVILGATSLSPNVIVGRNSHISQGAIVGHDTIVGDNVSVMPGARISGNVVIGSNVLIGSGAVILEKIIIGEEAVIGAASLVTRNVDAGKTVMGIPAKERM